MLQRQNYKEFIVEQGAIQTAVAEGWGYQVNPKEYVYQQTKTIQQQPKVALIEPLKKIVDVPISKKLQKIEQELLMIQNQKKLAKMTQQAKKNLANGGQLSQNECAAIKMMKKRIQEYNFIVDHRHIIQKKSERARKILGIQKTKAETLNQQIQELKDRIPKSSFSELIEINKRIAQLYRTYEKNLFESKPTSQINYSTRITSPKRSMTKKSSTTFNSLQNSSKIESQVRTDKNGRMTVKQRSQSINKKQKSKSNSVSIKDIVIMQQLKQSSQGDSFVGQSQIVQEMISISAKPQSLFYDHKGLKLQKRISENVNRKRLHTVLEKKSIVEERREKLNKTITESFITKEKLQKGKALDRRLRQNEDVIDVWRQRIDQNKEKNNALAIRLQPKAKKFKTSLKNTSNDLDPVQKEEDLQKMRIARKNLAYRMNQVRGEMNQKQKMFAILIKKKQSRFKKVPGTQIIQQNDPKEKAKKILGITKTSTEHFEDSSNKNKRKSTNQTDEPQWCFIQNEDDNQQLYWSMCRNEKLNILLRKNHK